MTKEIQIITIRKLNSKITFSSEPLVSSLLDSSVEVASRLFLGFFTGFSARSFEYLVITAVVRSLNRSGIIVLFQLFKKYIA